MLFALLVIFVCVAFPIATAGAAEQGLVRLDLTIGKSQIIDLKEPFTRLSVTNPGIPDVFAITPNQILLNGKVGGLTAIAVFYPDKPPFFDMVLHLGISRFTVHLPENTP